MKSDFFEMYSRQSGLSLGISHNSVADWIVIVRDKKGIPLGQEGKEIVYVQDCDADYVFAKAYVALADYLSDTRGGY